MTTLEDKTTSKSLLAGLRDRDPVAWARVAEVYGPVIEVWCRQSRLPAPDVDEVVQRVMVAVITKAAEYREKHPTRSFRKWLWKVTRHKLIDTYREVYRTQLVDPLVAEAWLAEDGLSPDNPPDSPSLIDETLQRAMEMVRGRCKQQTWEIFLRNVRGEGSTKDIAADFGVTVEVVRQTKKRILQRINAVLEMLDQSDVN